MNDDLNYAADTYTMAQVKPLADKCRAGKCTSYIHCMFGRPRSDGGVPMPVCAQNVERSLLNRQTIASKVAFADKVIALMREIEPECRGFEDLFPSIRK